MERALLAGKLVDPSTERELVAQCADCRAYVDPDDDRNYAWGSDLVLCPACAARRGGAYDELSGRWITLPDLTGLDDERRPHP